MSPPERLNQSAKSTLSEYERAKARVMLFLALEKHGKAVVRDLLDSSPEEWANKWFSGEEWAIRQAGRTKDLWAYSPKTLKQLNFGSFPKGLTKGSGVGQFGYRLWNPLMENKSEARKRLESRFLAHLTAEMDAHASQIGWRPKRGRQNMERDAKWFALYQFSNKTAGEIALAENKGRVDRECSANKVGKAVMRFAEVVGLPVREGNRSGRPREDL